MMKYVLFVGAALALPLASVPAAAQLVDQVRFAPGQSSSTVTDRIVGRQYKDYRIGVRAGQMLRVNMRTLLGSPYFNVMEPGQNEVAMYIGSNSGSDFEARARMSGDYTVRVYQMRNDERRGAIAAYRLTMAATGGGGGNWGSGSGHPNAPAHHPGDALVRGTPYHAVATIRCRSTPGAGMAMCKAGVIRRPGSATVHLDTPDGGERTILFRDGRAISSDAQARMFVDRRGDTSVIRIGQYEVYEIPDALPFGG